MYIPVAIKTLAEDNHYKLKDFLKDPNPGERFMQKTLENNYHFYSKSITQTKNYKENEQYNNLGLILIRPEMYHMTPNIIEFLEKHSFSIQYAKDLKIDARTYWEIYSDAITNHGAKFIMPTRTIIYLNSLCKLLIVHSPKYPNTSDTLVAKLKGNAGIYQPDTLRGDIILNEALRLNFDVLTNKTIQMAVDPLGVLHKYIPRDKRLQYNAVSIHIPNSKELYGDLTLLLNKKELRNLYAK